MGQSQGLKAGKRQSKKREEVGQESIKDHPKEAFLEFSSSFSRSSRSVLMIVFGSSNPPSLGWALIVRITAKSSISQKLVFNLSILTKAVG